MLAILLAALPLADAPADFVIEATPTWRAVGVEGRFTGDDNGNATAELEWRPAGEEKWRPGVEPVVERKLKRVWASVGPLSPGTTVEVRLTLRDVDLPRPLVVEAKTTTRTYP